MSYRLSKRIVSSLIAFFILTFFSASLGIHPGFHFTQNANAQICEGHPACRGGYYNRSTCRMYLDAPTGTRRFNARDFGEFTGRSVRTSGSIDGQNCYRGDREFMLQGFRFNTRGGHKINKISYFQTLDQNRVSFAFHDRDEDDFADGYVWLRRTPFGSSTMRTVIQQGCSGECFINLGRIANGRQVALAGFSFRRTDGEGHVRRVAVMPQQLRGTTNAGYMVAFEDDGFEYDVSLQYVLLPSGTLEGIRLESRNYSPDNIGRTILDHGTPEPRTVASGLVAPHVQRTTVLLGFDLEFTNGGHFLEDIGIEPHAFAYEVWFQDNQGVEDRRTPDDPFRWTIAYSFLSGQ